MSSADERMKRFVDAFLLGIPHIKALGIAYHGHGRGWAELQLPYAGHLVAYPDDSAGGIIASGAILTLMDSVGGFAVMTAAEKMQPVATLDLRLDYLRAATPGKAVTGHAEVVKMTRSVVFVKGSAHDGEAGRPIALMTGTFMFTAGAKQ